MNYLIYENTPLAIEGSMQPLTLSLVVGEPKHKYPSEVIHKKKTIASDEIRVTILGGGPIR